MGKRPRPAAAAAESAEASGAEASDGDAAALIQAARRRLPVWEAREALLDAVREVRTPLCS